MEPKFFKFLDKCLSRPVSVYVPGVADEFAHGVLMDFDDEYIYLRTEESMDAWRLDAIAGVIALVEKTEDVVEIINAVDNVKY